MRLIDHYTKTERSYVALTTDQIKALRGYSLIISNSGDVIRVKINGAVKTWKRDPARWEVPVKYGLYDCARIENTNTINIFVAEV